MKTNKIEVEEGIPWKIAVVKVDIRYNLKATNKKK